MVPGVAFVRWNGAGTFPELIAPRRGRSKPVDNAIRGRMIRLALSQLEWALYFTPPGTPPGEEGITPADLRSLAAGNAISSMLGAVGYIGPDQEGGPDPHGPLGPVIRDALIGLTVAH